MANPILTNPLPYDLDAQKHPADYWPTPAHAVESLLQVCPPPESLPVVEPAAGDGAIVRVLRSAGYGPIHAVDIRPECAEHLQRDAVLEQAREDLDSKLPWQRAQARAWWLDDSEEAGSLQWICNSLPLLSADHERRKALGREVACG